MKNLSKNIKYLIYSAIGLLILITIALILVLTQSPEEPDDIVDIPNENPAILLSDFMIEDVVRVSVRNANDEYVIERDGEVFDIKELTNAPIDTVRLEGTARNAARLRVQAVVEEEAADLEQYGLGETAAWFKVEFKNGESLEIYVGDPTPTTEPHSYIRVKGENTVYTIWSHAVNNFREDRLFYISLNLTATFEEAGMPLIDKMTISYDDGITYEIELIPEPAEGEYTTTFNLHRITEPYRFELGVTESFPIITGLFGLTAIKTVYAGNIDYEITGLDLPIMTVEMSVGGQRSRSLKIGHNYFAEDENGFNRLIGFYGVYSEFPDVVFVFAPDSLPWLNFDAEQIMAKLFHLPDIRSLSDFIIETDRHNLHFTLTQNSEFFLDGVKVDDSAFRSLYQYCISAPADNLFRGDYNEVRDFPHIATITYKYNSGRPNDVITFLDSPDDRRVIIVMNGEPRFTSRTAFFTRLLQNIDLYVSGEPVIMGW